MKHPSLIKSTEYTKGAKPVLGPNRMMPYFYTGYMISNSSDSKQQNSFSKSFSYMHVHKCIYGDKVDLKKKYIEIY